MGVARRRAVYSATTAGGAAVLHVPFLRIMQRCFLVFRKSFLRLVIMMLLHFGLSLNDWSSACTTRWRLSWLQHSGLPVCWFPRVQPQTFGLAQYLHGLPSLQQVGARLGWISRRANACGLWWQRWIGLPSVALGGRRSYLETAHPPRPCKRTWCRGWCTWPGFGSPALGARQRI